MPFFQLIKKQIIPASLDQVWDFISSPKNLKDITPGYMGFTITSGDLPEKMHQGMIISYKMKPLFGIPLTWVTEITQVVEKRFFVDEQRIGPYSFWHHQHKIEPFGEGVLMTDIVSYKPPMRFLGGLANRLFIRPQLEKIFAFREIALARRLSNTEAK